MTATQLGSLGRTTPSAARFTTAGLVKAGIGVALLVGVVAVALGTAQTGPEGDPRLTNPNPTGEVLTQGYPRPSAPLWGVDNWPVVFGTAFLVVSLLVMVPLVVRSVRERRVGHALMVFACVAVMAMLDPVANWASFTIYDPRLLHFPTTWTWMRFSPSVEPLLVGPGYPFYYFTIAVVSFWLGQRVIYPRLPSGSWFVRHPRSLLAGVAFVVAFAWDVPTELLMIRANMYTYSQRFGPTIHWGSNHSGLPIIWSLYTVLSITAITPFLHRDDSGHSLLSRLAERLPHFRRGSATNQPTGQSAGRQIAAGGMALLAIYLVITGGYLALRVSGLAHRTNDGPWPYGEIKTYDPYGDLEADGVPGPYYK